MSKDPKKDDENLKALDELFTASALYRNSKHFLELLNFINKFPSLSPFNAFLIHMQNNGVKVVLSPSKWKKHGRKIKYNSRPLVILVPFGPVEFVYDISDTEGDPIPESLTNPFFTRGNLAQDVFNRITKNCYMDNINYQEDQMHISSAGYATSRDRKSFKVVVNSAYPMNVKYSTLVHELGHIYAGHLGIVAGSWWKERRNLSKIAVEIEAESISFLVCKRMGLKTTSEAYLSEYISKNDALPSISLEIILSVAGYIEKLGGSNFKLRKQIK